VGGFFAFSILQLFEKVDEKLSSRDGTCPANISLCNDLNLHKPGLRDTSGLMER
jgi:hypothetical protein